MAKTNHATIPIDSIIINRELFPRDDVSALAASITNTGLKRPVLVDENYHLIDGLRRIRAVQSLGKDAIGFKVCTTLEETCDGLQATIKHGVEAKPLYPRRAKELFDDTHAQMMERSIRLRQRRIGLRRDEIAPPIVQSRLLLAQTLGLTSEGYINASTLLYRAFEKETEPHKRTALLEIKRLLENGELTLYEARGRAMKLDKKNNGGIASVSDQRDAMATAISQLSGMTKGIALLGDFNNEFTAAELQVYLRGFESGRRDLQRFINSLRKRVNEQ